MLTTVCSVNFKKAGEESKAKQGNKIAENYVPRVPENDVPGAANTLKRSLLVRRFPSPEFRSGHLTDHE